MCQKACVSATDNTGGQYARVKVNMDGLSSKYQIIDAAGTVWKTDTHSVASSIVDIPTGDSNPPNSCSIGDYYSVLVVVDGLSGFPEGEFTLRITVSGTYEYMGCDTYSTELWDTWRSGTIPTIVIDVTLYNGDAITFDWGVNSYPEA